MIRTLFQLAGSSPPAHASYTPDLLAFADRTQLTLQLRDAPDLPAWLGEEIEVRFRRNAVRRKQMRDAYEEIAARLSGRGIPYILLKGFTHEVGFDIDPAARIQYDLDILVAPASLARAQGAIEGLGYVPQGDHSLSDEHSRPLVRPSAWRWQGDYFDTKIPLQVELHDTLWSPAKDRITVPGLDRFWSRRRLLNVNGIAIPALSGMDRVAFAALHTLRHILRHDARPAHVHELARFLASRAHDNAFWTEWNSRYSPRLKALQTVAFRFAQVWFDCPWPGVLAEEWSRQPQGVTGWFPHFAWSPVENLLRPNKDTVWLHCALSESWTDRASVFCDRLLPLRLPHGNPLRRLRYHAAAFAPALLSGVRWWWRRDAASTASHTSDWKRRSV